MIRPNRFSLYNESPDSWTFSQAGLGGIENEENRAVFGGWHAAHRS